MRYKTKGSIVFDVFNYTFITLLMLSMIYPLWYVLIVSISDYDAVATNAVKLWPVGFNLEAYSIVFKSSDVPRAFFNSVIISVSATIYTLIYATMAAYLLYHPKYKYKSGLMKFFVVAMFLPGGMIPNFLLINSLGMYNTILSVTLPSAFKVWNIIMIRANMKATIPEELLDAANIDGASDWRILFQIVMPLLKPILATIALFVMVDKWNDFMDPLIYLNDADKYPLAIILRKILLSSESKQLYESAIGGSGSETRLGIGFFEALKMATVMVATTPILLLYPFLQKYFVKGVMVGSLKG